MKTINKLLKYKLSKKQKNILLDKKICNWCWWKWWINIDNLFHKFELRVEKLPFINLDKLNLLYKDISQLCSFNHDIDFALGWNLWNYIYANFDFVYKIIKLLHWTSKYARIIIFITLFTWLNLFWRKYFSWGRKKQFAWPIFIRKK